MGDELENGNGTDEVRYLDVCKMIISPRLREDNDEKRVMNSNFIGPVIDSSGGVAADTLNY